MKEKIYAFVRRETVLCAAVALAAGSSLFYTPKAAYIDFDVLSILLSLMLVVAGLKQIRFLDWAAVELLNCCQSMRGVVLALVGITYVSSMFVTNDVALITFVPLALVIGRTIKADMARVIILQTLAANLGSMLTPPGNPQNLFLYAHFDYTAAAFFKVMALPCLLSLLYLGVLIWRRPNKSLSLSLQPMAMPPALQTGLFLLLLGINIGAVLHWLDKNVALAVTVAAVLAVKRQLFKEVDYSLLVTFVGFFVFIGNISHTGLATWLRQSLLGTATGTYLAGLGASQLISNVPAAMLLAGLTNEADALLLGVNIGGLGTLIASMASVISYKLFVVEHPYQAGTYLRTFLYYNFAGLFLIGALTWVIFIR
ncbi:SLC13 family permease [Phascolarctobacterium sp.]|uniref:SLC13 family permease n=1 Tax=Phascolarctobacterium sp. TaxID=2049039 RepID=UPI00386CAD91